MSSLALDFALASSERRDEEQKKGRLPSKLK